jgi:glycosyltransferase involved in cell wall biosynthesis
VLVALKELKSNNIDVVVVASGNPVDGRNPAYPTTVLETVMRYGLEDSFRFLGLIPYEHIMPLMRGALAVINPSLFEGWSTTVEEAKSLGVPLLLSDIGVHREQASGVAQFFDPHVPHALATCMEVAWKNIDLAQRPAMEASAISAYRVKRAEFAMQFSRFLERTLVR